MHSFIGEFVTKREVISRKINTERNKGVASVRDIYLSGEELFLIIIIMSCFKVIVLKL